MVHVLKSKFRREDMLRLLSYFTKFMKCDQNFGVTGFQATVVIIATPAMIMAGYK